MAIIDNSYVFNYGDNNTFSKFLNENFSKPLSLITQEEILKEMEK